MFFCPSFLQFLSVCILELTLDLGVYSGIPIHHKTPRGTTDRAHGRGDVIDVDARSAAAGLANVVERRLRPSAWIWIHESNSIQ